MSIPTVQQCVDAAVAALESNLGQDVPSYDKSFLRILAVLIGMNNAELYRFGAQRAKQVLALTARNDDLTYLGREYGVIRKPEQRSEIFVSVPLPATGAGTIAKTDTMRCDANSMYYFPLDDYPFTGVDTSVVIRVRAEFAGSDGDLDAGTELYFSAAPENASTTGTAQSVPLAGSDEETDDELRVRILDEVQTVGGGSNLADYRTWGQRTPNVYRVDPYTGSEPWATSVPGERTVFVEATTAYDPDGLADAALLSLVTDYINYDQDTGLRQPCLGSTDDTLTVSSIVRNPAYFNIHNLQVEATRYYECQVAIQETLNELTYAMRPFIMGLDAEAFRNDTLTPSYASRHVQRVVQAYGGYVGTVDIGISYGVWLNSYEMMPGERLSAVVSYVS